jgi:type I restriction enzyme S subunit
MADDWHDTTLGDVLTLQRGFDLPETDRKAGPYPVIASTGPVGTHEEAMVPGHGVVIGQSGSLGGGQFIEGDFWPLNTTLWVKDFKGNDRRFCYYLLKSLDLAHFNAGSGVPTLNRNHIHPLPVTVPKDPREQRAIAHILGTLDDKIELNRRMSETLEAMARALFKSWFVDFDPVRLPAGRQAPREQAQPFPKPGTWCAYALECDDGSTYIGHTDNLERRFEEHRKGKGADWTKRHPPKRVAFLGAA